MPGTPSLALHKPFDENTRIWQNNKKLSRLSALTERIPYRVFRQVSLRRFPIGFQIRSYDPSFFCLNV
jgi:hypothetical protein